MTIDYDLFREKLNALNGEIFKMTNEQQVLPVLAIHKILKECEVEEMTDKERIEDLERRVYQLEDIIQRLQGDENGLWIKVIDAPAGKYYKESYYSYLMEHYKFGKRVDKEWQE